MQKPKPSLTPRHPDFAARVAASFAKQTVMTTIGAELASVVAGDVQIRLPFSDSLTQQNGFLHAGIVTTIVDSACGYAALTLMDADSEVLTIEFKTNFIAPAQGDHFLAVGQVVKAGRTITVCEGFVLAQTEGDEKLIATMQATLIRVPT